MSLLDTKDKRKSMTITVILHVIILLLLFYFGFTYLDPPPENGIAVNFGTMDYGKGDEQPNEPIKTAPKETTPEPIPETKTEVNEEVVTQDNEDAPVIKKEKKETIKEIPKEVPKKEETKKPDPKPQKTTINTINNILNAPTNDGNTSKSEGDDTRIGEKGDPNASAYYGTGKGLDGDGNYLLGGRKALNKAKYLQDCNEAGIVVVSIDVDRAGNVISATPGVKTKVDGKVIGTTNNTKCLMEAAKRSALATKFNPDENAPSKQIGEIIYNFKLSD